MEEIWKDINGYEGVYMVSNHGRVQRVGGKILKERRCTKGYVQYLLCKDGTCKNTMAHRLVANAFIHNINSHPQVNHKNGVRYYNNADNLEWVTNLENTRHSWEQLNRQPSFCGEKSHKAKLTEENVADIKRLLQTSKCIDIAKMYNVHKSTISHIKRNKNWKHLA